MISSLFLGILVLIQIPLTILVGVRRLKTDIHFLDHGDISLLRRMRAHGNFTETVPITLVGMILAEMSQAPTWLLWAGGIALVTGRLIHAFTIMRYGWGPGRAIGMSLTFAAMAGFACSLIWSFFN